MDLPTRVIAWFADPMNWTGPDGIPNRLLEHLQISSSAIGLALLIALPIGLYIGHTGRGAFLAVSVANIGRAVPSYAVLVILFPISIALTRGSEVSFTFLPTFLAMTILAIPPIVTNTHVGLREVDRELTEAGRGMGMRGWQVLGRIELPNGLPVILAGARTAAVQVVATATLGAVIGGGGLGRYIIQGIARRENERVIAGALLVASLAIATELVFAVLQRRAVSAGLRQIEPSGASNRGIAGPGRLESPG